ncbi:MAG: NlpC/P60 family protein [Megasphaera sp.]|jgi:cell wall-associated NlpC family hydrolase|nr:NlpC/P60 family protein [Megasphaera sp.]
MKNVKKTVSFLCLLTVLSISAVGATFHPGDRGDQIVVIQQALANNGYNTLADGDYGAGTQQAVKDFQASHGLDADGIVGASTYRALVGTDMPQNTSSQYVANTAAAASAPAAPVVTAGNEIRVIQQSLANQGYNVDVDGVFGVGTEQAVQQFQSSHGLETDGVVGSATFYELTGQVLPTGPVRRFGNGGFGGSTVVDNPATGSILQIADKYIGVPYVFGGNTPSGFDCSGFTRYVYSKVGIDLPRMADEQYSVGYEVSMANLKPGDLVFFTTYLPGVSHVGIYMGNRQFINASSEGVSIADMGSSYWSSRFVGAKRVM